MINTKLKAEFGGVKAALLYCVEMNMNKAQSCRFLGIGKKALNNRARQYSITFPDGYVTRDMTLTNTVNSERLTRLNRARLMGRAKSK